MDADLPFYSSFRYFRGLNSFARPVVTSAWTGLREALQASPWPVGQRAFLKVAWA